VPWPWEVEVLLDLPREAAAQRLPATLAELVELDEGTLLTMRVSSLDWMARVLAGLGCDFAIRRRTSSEGASGHWRIAWPPPPER
jgi:predicted DNA-binding transcriptional regulator YafY